MRNLSAAIAILSLIVAIALGMWANSLSDRLTELEATPAPEVFDPSLLASGLADVTDRIAALEDTPVPEPFDPALLEARIAADDKRLADLESRPAPEVFDPSLLASGLADVTDRIAALEDRPVPEPFDPALLEARIGDFVGQITGIETGTRQIKTVRPRPFGKVYFDIESSRVSVRERAKILSWVAELAPSARNFALIGFADKDGSRAYNRNLSLRRAIAVRDLLIELGQEQTVVSSIDAVGEDAVAESSSVDSDQAKYRAVHIYVYD